MLRPQMRLRSISPKILDQPLGSRAGVDHFVAEHSYAPFGILGQWVAWTCLLLATGFMGCGDSDAPKAGKVYEVKGSVILADGKPLTTGSVEFEPVKDSMFPATGAIGTDGTFTLKTPNAGEGAVPGEYRVRIVPDEDRLAPVKKGNAVTRDLSKLPFPPKYLDADMSELVVTIKPEANQLPPFKLTKDSRTAAAATRSTD
jgi:hypothetical protein